MSTMQQRNDGLAGPITRLVGRASNLIQQLAQPWLAQLMLRIALSVPFWKSGILKWHGFLQLSDTAIALFDDEFRLHLPGGPYPFPAPAVFAFLSACGEVTFPVLLDRSGEPRAEAEHKHDKLRPRAAHQCQADCSQQVQS